MDAQRTVKVNEVSTAAAVVGLGISMIQGGCWNEIHSGTLVQMLPEWNMGMIDVHAVFAAGRAAKPSARTFADFLIAELDETTLQRAKQPD
ncbi:MULTISPECIES: LysR substrate-binding domain-containing protein [unclassified Pseudomonas]|uniref:LysR substrate-binding domain-containing protein n=1 Tax=unclassified Pseudomonas TaxID=196821 RepID=UPI002AC948B9|nr:MULTISPECIES: LysR substrate-binding domain-containing protein [unclassified Pseudomonas]MEB0079970.1 LysR substrate-binding domain-containing protein [Pseudomonas sp. MH10out]MEB0170131.1 LysR substrate-binding domain-containing protein [Pseudomonas sp. CCC4.4]MEB0043606.1 LysR substrate-binding domain-containing protein [Pseudomonas sp. MH10]MEB0093987.1 LysR substrate-binding domain-containing protein [Pseudomonas sp. CCI4.2]MEB0102436.1 LysR substrate-binding domain-containing protein [